ncbi:hypothetical protein QOT17_007101 [Balamuthia mandrillaris]
MLKPNSYSTRNNFSKMMSQLRTGRTSSARPSALPVAATATATATATAATVPTADHASASSSAYSTASSSSSSSSSMEYPLRGGYVANHQRLANFRTRATTLFVSRNLSTRSTPLASRHNHIPTRRLATSNNNGGSTRASSSTSSSNSSSSSRLNTFKRVGGTQRSFIQVKASKEGKVEENTEVAEEWDALHERLSLLVQNEIDDCQAVTSYHNAYLQSHGFKLEIKNGLAIMTKNTPKHRIKIQWRPDDDEEDEEATDEEEEEEEEEEESIGLTDVLHGEEKLAALQIPFLATITAVDKSNKELGTLSVTCSANGERFYIETIRSSVGDHLLDFIELKDELQYRLYQYLCGLDLNNDLAKFISTYTKHYNTFANVELLHELKEFFNLGVDARKKKERKKKDLKAEENEAEEEGAGAGTKEIKRRGRPSKKGKEE